MPLRRSVIAATLSALRARVVQEIDGRRGVGTIARLMPVQLGSRPPRGIAAPAARVADLARPIRCPQRRRGTQDLDHAPPPESAEFARLLRRVRRRRDVVVTATSSMPDARSIVVLAAAGVQVRLRADTPAPSGLDDALVEQLRTPVGKGDQEGELRSVRLRRLAHDRLWRGPSGRPVSVLLASNRPDDVGFALEQIRGQVDVDVQVVVGLHGDHWPSGAVEQLGPLPDGSTATRFDADLPLGAVLGALAERADCDLVTKWDDDDWYGSEHLADLVRAYDYSGADVVGKAAEFVRLEASDLTIRRFAIGAESYSSTVAGGTILTSVDWLRAIGGWAPIPRNVDRALLDATRRCGGSSYRTHGFQYVLRRRAGHGHTWTVSDAAFVESSTICRDGLDLALADIEPSSDTLVGEK